ncbi:MAG: ATP-binding protein [Candidatus Binatia bacterium]
MGSPRRARRAATVTAIGSLGLLVALAFATAQTGLAWISRPFPGFFLLRNRVVASVSLPGWSVVPFSEAYQTAVVAVDGRAVASSADVYGYVVSQPVGTPIEYTFERPDGVRTVLRLPTQRFTARDGILLFGVYLLNGLVFGAIGIGVWVVSPQRAAPWAVLALGATCGLYALTAIDLYGPHTFFRLHAMAECALPAAFLYLGLLFPVRRMRVWPAIALSFGPFVPLAIVYQLRLDTAAAYPGVHELTTICTVGAMIFLLGSGLWAYLYAPSDLVRHRVRVVALGLGAGFGLPSAILASSALTNGQVPVNVIGLTGFFFPLSVAYAVHKRDLFAIDALVQRGIYYGVLSGIVTVSYLAFAALGTGVFHSSAVGQSPAFSLAFTLVAIFVLPPTRERIQRTVDRLCGRQPYDAQAVLASASTALGSTLELDAILAMTVGVPMRVLQVEHAAVYLREEGGERFARAVSHPADAGPASVPAAAPLVAALATAPQLLVRAVLPEQAEAERAETVALFEALGAELLVPLACQGALVGFVVCGRKQAGTSFAAMDAAFLRTFANQAALSLQNARTFQDLCKLNQELEARVEERTHELAASKDRLSLSLGQLESAYADLQASQERLVLAEKMAAFGRLAAGIAHEVNTPLGAALNGLKVARDLIAEAEEVAADDAATEEDLRAVAADLRGLVINVEDWTRKAVAYIRSVKGQARQGGPSEPFDLRQLLERGLQPLLMHRVRLAGGELEFDVAPDLPELHGDSGRLGQVLANLLTNAIDASEGLSPERHGILVTAAREGSEIVVAVRDRGTGIPDDVLQHVFEEFYTTKPLGKGTGLGLALARDIVTGEFGGTLACTATGPEGTTFTIHLPIGTRRESDSDVAA